MPIEDERGRVVMDVVRYDSLFASDMRGPSGGISTLDRWLIDPAVSKVTERRLDDEMQEFPRIDERLIGKPYRFGYTAGLGEDLALGWNQETRSA